MGSPRSCSPLPQEGRARPRAPPYSIPYTRLPSLAVGRAENVAWSSPGVSSVQYAAFLEPTWRDGARRTAEGLPAPALGRRPPHPFVPSAKISISVKPLEQSPLCCKMKVRGRVLGRV